MYIKVRKTDNVIFGSQKESWSFVDADLYYEVENDFVFPEIQPYYFYVWDVNNNQVIVNDNEDIINFENKKVSTNLRIMEFLEQDIDYRNFDFTLVLIKDEPQYYKGEKKIQDYTDQNDNLVVRKTYSEVIGDRIIYGTVSPNRILAQSIKIEWMTWDNTVGDTKEVVVKKFTREEEGERRIARRAKQISNLTGMAAGTPIENVVEAIYTHYDEPIRYYINQGSISFYDALQNETDPTILYYINLQLPKTIYVPLTIDDFIVNDENNTIDFMLDFNYDNYMLTIVNSGTSISAIADVVNFAESDNNTILYNGFDDETQKYSFSINADEFVRQDVTFILTYYNTLKEYIEGSIT